MNRAACVQVTASPHAYEYLGSQSRLVTLASTAATTPDALHLKFMARLLVQQNRKNRDLTATQKRWASTAWSSTGDNLDQNYAFFL
jgi:hypothetical protein